MTQITLTAEEVHGLHGRVLPFVSVDGPELTDVMCRSQNGVVDWTGTDSVRLARLRLGRADGDGDFTVPGRIIHLAWQMCGAREAAGVELSSADGVGRLSVDGVVVPFTSYLDRFPDLEEFVGDSRPADVEVTLLSADLFAMLHSARLAPQWLDSDDQVGFWLTTDAGAGTLRATARWNGYEDTSASAPCRANGDIRVYIDPDFLFTLADAASKEVLTIEIHEDDRVPLRVRTDDGFLALLMPKKSSLESARPGFETHLASVIGCETDDLVRDDDGDYPVGVGDEVSLFIRLLPGEPESMIPDLVRVFSPLADGVESTLDALTEINDLNVNLGTGRVFLVSGQVLVTTELLLESLDEVELRHAMSSTADLARRVAPLLRMVHGATSAGGLP